MKLSKGDRQTEHGDSVCVHNRVIHDFHDFHEYLNFMRFMNIHEIHEIRRSYLF